MTSLGSLSLAYLSMFSQSKWCQSIFRNRFLTYTGVISYGLYLLHRIPYDATKAIHLDRRPLIGFFVIVVFSYLLAALS